MFSSTKIFLIYFDMPAVFLYLFVSLALFYSHKSYSNELINDTSKPLSVGANIDIALKKNPTEKKIYINQYGEYKQISPDKYKSNDNCEKAKELLLYRTDNGFKKKLIRDYQILPDNFKNINLVEKLLIVMKDVDGTFRALNCGYYGLIDEVCTPVKDRVDYVFLGKIDWRSVYGQVSNIKNYNASYDEFLYLTVEDCILSYYKGENIEL